MAQQDRGLVSRFGAIEIDWPRSLGYFGAIGLASTFGLIEPPVAIFIAAVPFCKMLNRPNVGQPTRFVGQVLEGAGKPVGGDGEATIRIVQSHNEHRPASIMEEARALAHRLHSKDQQKKQPAKPIRIEQVAETEHTAQPLPEQQSSDWPQ